MRAQIDFELQRRVAAVEDSLGLDVTHALRQLIRMRAEWAEELIAYGAQTAMKKSDITFIDRQITKIVKQAEKTLATVEAAEDAVERRMEDW